MTPLPLPRVLRPLTRFAIIDVVTSPERIPPSPSGSSCPRTTRSTSGSTVLSSRPAEISSPARPSRKRRARVSPDTPSSMPTSEPRSTSMRTTPYRDSLERTAATIGALSEGARSSSSSASSGPVMFLMSHSSYCGSGRSLTTSAPLSVWTTRASIPCSARIPATTSGLSKGVRMTYRLIVVPLTAPPSWRAPRPRADPARPPRAAPAPRP